MNKNDENKSRGKPDFFLDITPETCPMTFVRTKLMIEKMASGEVAEVHLKGAEPLGNVPRSVQDMGHSIISLEPIEADGGDDGVHRLIILKV
jgi:TusA-related sulfurtransferase